jgi:hypothetical protein
MLGVAVEKLAGLGRGKSGICEKTHKKRCFTQKSRVKTTDEKIF